MKKSVFLASVLTFLILMPFSLEAQLKRITLSKLFSNGMVLQRNAQAPIWGNAPAESTVKVECGWDNKTYEVVVGKDERWMVKVNTPNSTPDNYGPFKIKINGTHSSLNLNTTTIRDVVIGEVWLNSGQSNMASRVFESWNDSWQVLGQNTEKIRFFVFPDNAFSETLQSDLPEGCAWKYGLVGDGQPMFYVSAVGYHFADMLQSVLGIPVGMISTAAGGTSIEEWCDASITKNNPDIKDLYEAQWKETPGRFYNAMLYPLAPYKISGFLWYQGENNASRPTTYQKASRLMIENWREVFQNPYLPFYLVQLPIFQYENGWKFMRDIQQSIADENPNTALAVTIETGEQDDIHHHSKRPVGRRLAQMALSRVYGMPEYPCSSPTYREAIIEGDKMRVYFDFANKGLKTNDDKTPRFFEVAGEDKMFYNASARIEGNTVVAWSKNVEKPLYVRYYWAVDVVRPNFFSIDDLPVAPFRNYKW